MNVSIDLSNDLSKLVARRRPGLSLEAPFYASPEIFQSDLEHIFYKHWLFVALEPEIPEAGDFVRIDVGVHSVIIVRDDENKIAAFHNVCRHRGARILTEERGIVGNLVCPYHQWTYDLDGNLIHAANMGKDFDPKCFGLKPVHIRSLAGLIFICLADEPPDDFDALSALVSPYISPHQVQNCKIAAQIDLIEEGNWKLTMENNRECYHCGGHPELGIGLTPFWGIHDDNVPDESKAIFEQRRQHEAAYREIWERNDLPYAAIEQLHGRPTGFRIERLTLRDDAESYTLDKKVACSKLLGNFTEKQLGGLNLHLQPNSWHHFLSDHAICFSVLPKSPTQTLLRTTWLVHKDAVEGTDYRIENLTHVWKATNQQDGSFVGFCQSGTLSPAYEPGPYSPIEDQVEKFCKWYIERLQSAKAVTLEG